jgi:tetratricopeptide (TPR) repeat protein
VADNPRIEDLRRRIQKDPASIAFAQLAEEYRRAGEFAEAIAVCRAGLALHPGYLSARVTLGRALIEVGQDEDAQRELEVVVKGAPENLAAIRGLAGIHHRRGALVEALTHYRAALNLAHNDPDLEETVSDLTRQLTPQKVAGPSDGLSLDLMEEELAVSSSSPHPALEETVNELTYQLTPRQEPELSDELSFDQMQEELSVSSVSPPPGDSPTPDSEGVPEAPPADPPIAAAVQQRELQPIIAPPPVPALPAPPPAAQVTDAAANREQARAIQTLAALEQWLAAIHVARADRHP